VIEKNQPPYIDIVAINFSIVWRSSAMA